MASLSIPNMNTHAQRQSDFTSLVIMGLVGGILVSIHAFAAFSPIFKAERFEVENRSFVAGPVTIFELAWSTFPLVTMRYTEAEAAGRTGPAILAGLVGVVAALLVLLVGGGARNWMAATLLVFLMFWGGVLLELGFGFVHRRVARATGTTGPGAQSRASPPSSAGADRWTLPTTPWAHRRFVLDAIARAAAAQAEAQSTPPPYEHPASMPSEDAATPLLPFRGARGNSTKTGDND